MDSTTQKTDKPKGLARNTVYHTLREDILTCRLRPGQKFQENDLLERFSVSRSPIRDALLKLEEQRLIEVMPRKGYRVRQINLSEVADMYVVRHMLERESVRLFIDFADDQILAGLDTFRDPPEDDDLATWIAYNRAFHAYIAHHCGNDRLARLAMSMIEEFDRLTYLSVSKVAATERASFGAEHRSIIDALQARDKRQAVVRTRSHIDGSKQRVMESLQSAAIIDTRS